MVNGVELVGCASRFASAAFPAELAVVDVTGRKLVDDGNADDVVVVVVAPTGVPNEKDAFVVVGTVAVDDGVPNEKPGAAVVVEMPAVAVVVAGVGKEKDGTV